MTYKTFARYFIRKCMDLRTFDIHTWLDADGYPKSYDNSRIKSTATIPEGVVQQSLYMAGGQNIYMGILDCDPGFGNDEIDLDLEYCFASNVLTMNYNNITLQESYDEDDQDELEEIDYRSIDLVLASSEEEHFQQSLLENKFFTFTEEQMMLTFFNEIRTRFFENKVPIR